MLLDLPSQPINLLESCCKDLRTNRDTNDLEVFPKTANAYQKTIELVNCDSMMRQRFRIPYEAPGLRFRLDHPYIGQCIWDDGWRVVVDAVVVNSGGNGALCLVYLEDWGPCSGESLYLIPQSSDKLTLNVRPVDFQKHLAFIMSVPVLPIINGRPDRIPASRTVQAFLRRFLGAKPSRNQVRSRKPPHSHSQLSCHGESASHRTRLTRGCP